MNVSRRTEHSLVQLGREEIQRTDAVKEREDASTPASDLVRIVEEGNVQCVHRRTPSEGIPLVLSAYGHTILMDHTLLV